MLVKLLFEMPHIETPEGFFDLRIENYNLTDEEKRFLMQKIRYDGVVGFSTVNGKWIYINVDSMREATEGEAKTLAHLPTDWEDYLLGE